ncbi:MAG: NapC/NirT family cytochrome c [Rhodospirillales bacterium]|nr:NapC/NirT family cytochrome c [Rhodospirillales bacterium]
MFKLFRQWFFSPSAKYSWGSIFLIGGIAGIVFWGGFNTVMEETNTLQFCVSCHEMEENVYEEYKETIHYKNRTGVRATCSDCHVPDPWVHKMVRKIQASNELLHKALGTIDTPEKFEDNRLTLAKNVWKAMKETDSRECRNCHSWDAMTDTKQQQRAWKRHSTARENNETCIDCHKGIAHRPVHKLLDEDDNPYDGKPDSRRLISKAEEAAQKAAAEEARLAAEAAAAEAAAKAAEEAAKKAAEDAVKAPSGASAVPVDNANWDDVPAQEIVLFYPGQASYEWILNGKDHGGGRAVRKANDRCSECHKTETAAMGAKIVTGEKAESTPIPGKRGSIPVNVKAMHDGENLSLRFEWPDAGHTPVPFADGGKMDPKNQIKLAVMFDDGKVEVAGYTGCWSTCHHDSRYMPDAPKADALSGAGAVSAIIDTNDGITKYIPDSRSELEYKGKNDKPRGGWDKLLEKGELDTKLAEGVYMDLTRYVSGSDKAEDGRIMAQRVLGPSDKVTSTGTLTDGKWTVTITRPLKSDKAGGVSFEPGNIYTMGFAIHDDYTSARFHHVSLEYKIGLDNPEAEINAIKK